MYIFCRYKYNRKKILISRNKASLKDHPLCLRIHCGQREVNRQRYESSGSFGDLVAHPGTKTRDEPSPGLSSFFYYRNRTLSESTRVSVKKKKKKKKKKEKRKSARGGTILAAEDLSSRGCEGRYLLIRINVHARYPARGYDMEAR